MLLVVEMLFCAEHSCAVCGGGMCDYDRTRSDINGKFDGDAVVRFHNLSLVLTIDVQVWVNDWHGRELKGKAT